MPREDKSKLVPYQVGPTPSQQHSNKIPNHLTHKVHQQPRNFGSHASTDTRKKYQKRFSTTTICDLPPSTTTTYSKYGHRIDCPVREGFPEAATHLLELQVQGQVVKGRQRRTKMVQGRWSWIQNTKERH